MPLYCTEQKHRDFVASGEAHHQYRHGHKLGGKPSPTYNCWSNMLKRCENSKNDMFHRYGARGIKVCKRWHVFKNFLDDMGPKPKGRMLERKDNNGNYNKSNCTWATPFAQANNTSKNVRVAYLGYNLTISEWARVLGFKVETLWVRLFQYNWPLIRAFGEPINYGRWHKKP